MLDNKGSKKFKLAAAVAMSVVGLVSSVAPMSVQAQGAGPMEEIVVQGIRKALERGVSFCCAGIYQLRWLNQRSD